jgi:allantoate deiminase
MVSPLAQKTLDRIGVLGAITDKPDVICRTFLSPAMQQANALVGGWMRELGGDVEEDGWGNLIGHFASAVPDAPTLLLGSHLDTVPNAGKFDGPLGVLAALASLESLKSRGIQLPFHVDVIGFSDEEGTRFHSAYLGSQALVGVISETDLDLRDAKGISVREAVAAHQGVEKLPLPVPRYHAENLLGYVEVHIEQGPVLEAEGVALGVVDAIAAQTRLVYTVEGKAGHAGTTPMKLRKDALVGAANMILLVQRTGLSTVGLVATVGQVTVEPGASNVIPSRVHFSVDIRHPQQRVAEEACALLARECQAIADNLGLHVSHVTVQSTNGVPCEPRFIEHLAQAVKNTQRFVPHLISGAGHDGIILSRITPMAMLFVRCKDGLSHHPDEHVELADIDAAITALTFFLEHFA